MHKVALVTGGTRGIGHDIVSALVASGYDVAVNGRSISATQRAWMDDLSSKHGVKVKEILCDLSDSNAIAAMFDAFKTDFGRIDLLVNNAGFESLNALEDFALDEWQRILSVNLTAPFLCSKYAVQIMKQQQSHGVIINISSIHDTMPRKGNGPYCIAKAGLHMLTKQSALEWAEYGIRVLTIGPGAIETDMNREAIDNFGRDNFNRWIPAARIGQGHEVADLVVYLASEQAAYITGIDVHIDGGYLLNTVRYDDRPGRTEIF